MSSSSYYSECNYKCIRVSKALRTEKVFEYFSVFIESFLCSLAHLTLSIFMHMYIYICV